MSSVYDPLGELADILAAPPPHRVAASTEPTKQKPEAEAEGGAVACPVCGEVFRRGEAGTRCWNRLCDGRLAGVGDCGF